MNGYSYLEDTQELKLEPFRYFYQALAKAKLENDQDSIKLNDFIKPTEIVEINNIINQKLADKSISDYPLVHYLVAVINTPSAYQVNALKWAIFNTQCIELLDSKEHAATVANLCRRFRLASKKQEYHWLYNLLPRITLKASLSISTNLSRPSSLVNTLSACFSAYSLMNLAAKSPIFSHGFTQGINC